MEVTLVLATIADGETAASWGEGKKNCKTRPESTFGWVQMGVSPWRLLILRLVTLNSELSD